MFTVFFYVILWFLNQHHWIDSDNIYQKSWEKCITFDSAIQVLGVNPK